MYLSCFTILASCTQSDHHRDRLGFSDHLVGHWTAPAFDGELHESWKIHDDGWLIQSGYYIENGDTTYRAKTKIEKVESEYVLFSIIDGNAPKIFQATEKTASHILFKNEEYKNPFQVKYEFISDQSYRRTITGHEQDSLVNYVFNFEKTVN